MSALKLVLLLLGAGGILWISRDSLRNVRVHGFFRMFAFAAILWLILLNLDVWFNNPFALNQLLSWVLLVASLVLAVHGFRTLREIGQSRGSFENTTRLVTVGAYHYIRHPLYGSLLLLAWGAALKQLSTPALLLALGATAFLWATARVEEAENAERFGAEYAAYCKTTRMFIPLVF